MKFPSRIGRLMLHPHNYPLDKITLPPYLSPRRKGRTMPIKFYIELHSPIPPHAQIIDRIKLALLTGELRAGDTLPSIRDVERESGVSRNIVRRAYLELEAYGLLKLKHGKGVIVSDELPYVTDQALVLLSQKLCREVLSKITALGLVGSSFARMLYSVAIMDERSQQRFFYVDVTEALAQERAEQISRAWQVTIAGLALEKIKMLEEVAAQMPMKVLTNFYRYGEVSSLIGHLNVDIIPVALKFTKETIEEIDRLREGSIVEIVLEERDFSSYGGLILANYQRTFAAKKVKFKVTSMTTVAELKRKLKSGDCHLLVISNRLWDKMPEDLKRLKMVTRPKMEFDARASEQARLRAGIIL
ncbi:MAG: GntR family transcriptional regulator [Acidobacteriota bacterium]|nr:GntR family transcriptional regulator [Acidobacteriota bacterium]